MSAAPTVVMPNGLEVRAVKCPCNGAQDLGGAGVCCSDDGYAAIESLTYCAICDEDRTPDTFGTEWGDDWFCADCWATRPAEIGGTR